MAIAIRDDQPVDRSSTDEAEWAVELPGGAVPASVQLGSWLR